MKKIIYVLAVLLLGGNANAAIRSIVDWDGGSNLTNRETSASAAKISRQNVLTPAPAMILKPQPAAMAKNWCIARFPAVVTTTNASP